MQEITYEDLLKAKQSQAKPEGEMDIMGMANIALKILEQVNLVKGNKVMTSRPPEGQTGATQASAPPFDIAQIKQTLSMVKAAKGDIKISDLEKLIDENKELLQQAIGGIHG